MALFLLLIAIGGLTASPFGILFSGESAGSDAVPVSAAVTQVNLAFNASLEQLPEELSEERKAVVREACSLVGKVDISGGQEPDFGLGQPLGSAEASGGPGSPTTGAYHPYGLDCSGFVDWVFYNATQGELVLGQGGGARMQHSACTPISWDEALPGDLVFYPDDTHVGIVCGRTENGELLIVHCASGSNSVIITEKHGFSTIAKLIQF